MEGSARFQASKSDGINPQQCNSNLQQMNEVGVNEPMTSLVNEVQSLEIQTEIKQTNKESATTSSGIESLKQLTLKALEQTQQKANHQK